MEKSSVGFPFNYELTGGEINVKAFHQILTRDWRISIKEEKTDDQGMDKILDEQDFYSRSLRCQGDFRQARSQEVRFQVVDLTGRSTSGRTAIGPTDRPTDREADELGIWSGPGRMEGNSKSQAKPSGKKERKKETDAKPPAGRTDRRTDGRGRTDADGRKEGRTTRDADRRFLQVCR